MEELSMELREELKRTDEMLRKAARPKLTPEEIRAQRVSFAMGMMGEKDTMTREQGRTASR